MNTFHFLTEWFFEAPIERVWGEITSVQSWPAWWRNWKKAELLTPAPGLSPGAIVANEVRGWLPYAFRFYTEITGILPPGRLALASTGDLVGNGCWRLSRNKGGTRVTFRWDVAASNPLLDRMGTLPVMKRLLDRNHDYIMANGCLGLKERLAAK